MPDARKSAFVYESPKIVGCRCVGDFEELFDIVVGDDLPFVRQGDDFFEPLGFALADDGEHPVSC